MVLRKEIIISPLDDGFVAVAAEEASEYFHGMIKLNSTGAFITKCLKEETTPEKIVSLVMENYDVPFDKALSDVNKLVASYRDIGLIIE